MGVALVNERINGRHRHSPVDRYDPIVGGVVGSKPLNCCHDRDEVVALFYVCLPVELLEAHLLNNDCGSEGSHFQDVVILLELYESPNQPTGSNTDHLHVLAESVECALSVVQELRGVSSDLRDLDCDHWVDKPVLTERFHADLYELVDRVNTRDHTINLAVVSGKSLYLAEITPHSVVPHD